MKENSIEEAKAILSCFIKIINVEQLEKETLIKIKEATEVLLADRERLKAENKELKTNRISLDTIKEKMKELTKQADDETMKDYDKIDYKKVEELLNKREILQELIEKRG